METVVTYKAHIWGLGHSDEEHAARDAWWRTVEWSKHLAWLDYGGEYKVIAVLPSKFDECERMAHAANVSIERD